MSNTRSISWSHLLISPAFRSLESEETKAEVALLNSQLPHTRPIDREYFLTSTSRQRTSDIKSCPSDNRNSDSIDGVTARRITDDDTTNASISSSSDALFFSTSRGRLDIDTQAAPSSELSASASPVGNTGTTTRETSPASFGSETSLPPLISEPENKFTSSDSTSLLISTQSNCLEYQYQTSCINYAGNVPQHLSSKPIFLYNAPLHKQPEAYTYADAPWHPHTPVPLCPPVVKFEVEDHNTFTYGVAVKDILEFEGMHMICPGDAMEQLWGDVAPGTSITLVIQWKGYEDEMLYPITVKCHCGSVIRRNQLALAIARAHVSYFETMKIHPTYASEEHNYGPYHRSKFIIKSIDNLHLMSLSTPDNGQTWRAQHAIIEDPVCVAANIHVTQNSLWHERGAEWLPYSSRVALAITRVEGQLDNRARAKFYAKEARLRLKYQQVRAQVARQKEKKRQKELKGGLAD